MINLNRTIAPPFNPVQNFQIIPPQHKEFNNGVKLFWFDGATQDVVRIDWIFENQYKEGVRPLLYSSLCSMLLEGTIDKTNAEIVDSIDFYGAYLVPEFGFDTTTISLYCLNKHLENLLPIVKEILIEASFPEKELKTFIRNSKQKLEISLQKNDWVARRNFYHQLFGQTRYGQISNPEDYDKIDSNQLKKLYQLQFQPNNCTIVLAGNVPNSTLILLESFFSGNQWTLHDNEFLGDLQSSKNASLEFPEDPSGLTFIEKPDALQSALRLGWRCIGRNHPDFASLQFLNTLLGGYFGSRLMVNIREDKGYTYGIGSGILSLKHTGFWSISTEVGVDVTLNTLSEIEKEIRILKTEKVSQNEIDLVRNYMMGSLLGSLENIFSHADRFKSVYFSGVDLEYYTKYQENIQNINSEQILLLANQYLDTDKMTKIVVGKMN